MTIVEGLLVLIACELFSIAWDVSKHRKLAEREFKMKYNGP